MIRATLCTFTKQTMDRVRRRTSTKQRSMMLVVRNFFHQRPAYDEERQQFRQVSFHWIAAPNAGQPFGHNRLQMLTLQASPKQILEQRFPVGLALASCAQKGQQFSPPIPLHPVGHQHLHPLAACGRRTLKLLRPETDTPSHHPAAPDGTVSPPGPAPA